MDDLLSGANDWRNIQDVVRQTFKALHDVVRSQGDKIRRLEQQIASGARAADLDTMRVSMANKPTFAELEKCVDARMEESGLFSVRKQLSAKADKADLKELYSDLTLATQRIGDGTNSLELVVRQQEAEIEALKRELRKLTAHKEAEEEHSARLATTKWVDDSLSFEAEARKQELAGLRKEVQERMGALELRLGELPSVATLDEVFAQKVDMKTLSRALEDRATLEQVGDEVESRLARILEASQRYAIEVSNEAGEAASEEIKALAERLQDSLTEKVGRAELLELCGQKVDSNELDDRLASATDTLAAEVKEAIVGIQKELVQVLNKKAFRADVTKLLQAKANVDDVQSWLSTKVELTDVRDSLAYKADLTLVQEALNRVESVEQRVSRQTAGGDPSRRRPRSRRPRTKSDRSDANVLATYLSNHEKDQERKQTGDITRTKHRRRRRGREEDSASSLGGGSESDSSWSEGRASFGGDDGNMHRMLRSMRRTLALLTRDKASVKDVCMLLDQKANITDVNDALAQLEPRGARDAAAGGPVKEDDPVIQSLRRELASIADAINAELAAGRWIWSSGRVLADRAVPWNIECINTCTDNFLWKQDSADITTVTPGLYELQIGFFQDADPDLHVLVNGEPVFFTSPPGARRRASHIPPVPSGLPRARALQRTKHSAGNISGWTALEFVALPARARLTVLFQGEAGTQGFLGLRKL